MGFGRKPNGREREQARQEAKQQVQLIFSSRISALLWDASLEVRQIRKAVLSAPVTKAKGSGQEFRLSAEAFR